MNKIVAAAAALFIAALPVVASAGADPDCPDYTGDGYVSIGDVLYVVDNYRTPKDGGGSYSIADILATVGRYGDTCA